MIRPQRLHLAPQEDRFLGATDSVVVYLELLGYKGSVGRVNCPDAINNTLRTLRDGLDHANDWVMQECNDDTPSWITRVFAGTIVVSFPHFDASTLTERQLRRMFLYISYLQSEMIRAGFFVRGAMAVGGLYVDDSIAFGKALLGACAEAQNFVSTPRIVLSHSAEQLVSKTPEWLNPVAGALKHPWLLRDTDNRLFVNYLDQTIFAVGVEAGPFLHELAVHRDLITDRLVTFKSDPAVRAKYEWAGRYHDFFCDLHGIERRLRVGALAQMTAFRLPGAQR